MPFDAMHLVQVVAITVALAVTVWFAAEAAIGWTLRAVKRIIAMARRQKNDIDRRTFPTIAWGISALVFALILILVLAKCTRG